MESESGRNTAALGGPNSDGSYDYGLFQINSRYWCKVGSPGGDCNIDCNCMMFLILLLILIFLLNALLINFENVTDFLDDHIADDMKCANLIYKRHGFKAWRGWVKKCQGALPDLSGCGL